MRAFKNDSFLRAIWRQPVVKTPVWMMRQAGRYLPEYRALRQKAGSFMQLCKTPELASEITLQPLARFPLDAAILFSDILTIPDAMGLGLSFKEGEGPIFAHPLRSEHDIARLRVPTPEVDLAYVLDAIRLTQKNLARQVPLIGFCGSPWTLATYMVEGCANKSFPRIQALRQGDPKLLHTLLDVLAKSVSAHLNAQIRAGVNAVMIFDTWGGMLNTADYQIFSLYYVKQVITHLLTQHEGSPIPVILFTKGGGQWLELMAATGCHVLGIDCQTDLSDARLRVGDKVALQGNLDPAILLESPERIRAAVAKTLSAFGKKPGHIFNLGHGVPQQVLPEHVAVLVDAVHELSEKQIPL